MDDSLKAEFKADLDRLAAAAVAGGLDGHDLQGIALGVLNGWLIGKEQPPKALSSAETADAMTELGGAIERMLTAIEEGR